MASLRKYPVPQMVAALMPATIAHQAQRTYSQRLPQWVDKAVRTLEQDAVFDVESDVGHVSFDFLC